LDRQIVYSGAVPLETDLLSTNKNAMFALGQLSQDIFGTSTVFNGLGCVPNTPAAMNVIVQPGVVYAQAALDATAYSSLASDSTVTQKQGILKAAQTFATPAPVTSGQSIVYLISAAFLEADTGATVLPYYNASNPAQAYSGPNNTGSSQNTLRQDTVQLTLTAGVPATTGSQVTPATPAGQIALYTITVAYGATTVIAGNIAKVAGAPFLSSGNIIAQIQAVPTSGRLLNVQRFAASGTYTPTTGTNKVVVEVWGGGGGGAGCPSTGAGQAAVAGGGGGGAYVKAQFSSGFSGGLAVTIGAGGTAGVAGLNAGGSGGTTSLGSIVTAAGGTGSAATPAGTPPLLGGAGGSGVVTSVTGGAVIDVSIGNSGGPAFAVAVGASLGGAGGNSNGHAGPAGGTAGSPGVAGASPGCGGSGGSQGASGGALAGGAGAPGQVIVWEYA
jgi:hypothetical protein